MERTYIKLNEGVSYTIKPAADLPGYEIRKYIYTGTGWKKVKGEKGVRYSATFESAEQYLKNNKF